MLKESTVSIHTSASELRVETAQIKFIVVPTPSKWSRPKTSLLLLQTRMLYSALLSDPVEIVFLVRVQNIASPENRRIKKKTSRLSITGTFHHVSG